MKFRFRLKARCKHVVVFISLARALIKFSFQETDFDQAFIAKYNHLIFFSKATHGSIYSRLK